MSKHHQHPLDSLLTGIVHDVVREEFEKLMQQLEPLVQQPKADELLSDAQIEEEYGYPSRATLQKWRANDEGPPYIRLGRTCRYRRSDIEAWLASNTVSTSTVRDDD